METLERQHINMKTRCGGLFGLRDVCNYRPRVARCARRIKARPTVRVLWAMNELGNYYNKAYKKSARVVGDVIGKYSSARRHGVYDTIVRMAQDFSMRYPLIDGQGNFWIGRWRRARRDALHRSAHGQVGQRSAG